MNIDAKILNKILANNSATHQKAYTPWSSWVYSRNARILQYLQINVIYHINKLKYKNHMIMSIRSDQSLSRVRLFAIPWIAAHQASLSITNSRSSLRLTSIESVMPSMLKAAEAVPPARETTPESCTWVFSPSLQTRDSLCECHTAKREPWPAPPVFSFQ